MRPNHFPTRHGCRTVLTEYSMVRLTSRALVACALFAGACAAHAADLVAMANTGGWQSLSAGPSVSSAQSAAAAPSTPSTHAPHSGVASTAALTGEPIPSRVTGSSPVPVEAAGPAHAIFALVGGESIEDQIKGWAEREGWKVEWKTPDDWIVPNDEPFDGDFVHSVTDAMTQLGNNGADVWVDVWVGNRTVVVDKAGAGE